MYVYETIKSLEVFDSVKIIGYEYKENPNEIKLNDYQRNRMQGGKKVQDDPVEVMFMSESRCGELTIHYELSIDVKQEDGTTKMMSKKYSKNILIPIKDDDGYYMLKGKRYILMYQLVDSTTYSTSNSVVLKSIMPIVLKRKSKVIHDVDRNPFTIPIYSTAIFKNEINMMLLFFAKMGFKEGLRYLSMEKVIELTNSLDDDLDKYVYFKISQEAFIKVNRFAFEESTEVKSVTGMILESVNNRATVKDMEDNAWGNKIKRTLDQNNW
jgi:hypothetical protein